MWGIMMGPYDVNVAVAKFRHQMINSKRSTVHLSFILYQCNHLGSTSDLTMVEGRLGNTV